MSFLLKFQRLFVLFVCSILIWGCAVNKPRSYFLEGEGDAGAGSASASASTVSLNQAVDWARLAEDVVLIWTDGSAGQGVPQFCPENPGALPELIQTLHRKQIPAGRITVYVHCPTVLGDFDWESRSGKGKAERVAEAIHREIDRFVSKGISPRRIVVAGQSSGGWASLIVARDWGKRLGGTIAFAPADHGLYKPLVMDTEGLTGWTLLKSLNFNDLLSSDQMPALIYAFPGDPFSSPNELSLLSHIPGARVDFVSRKDFLALDCRNYATNAHDQVRSRCFAELFGPHILNYIAWRIRPTS